VENQNVNDLHAAWGSLCFDFKTGPDKGTTPQKLSDPLSSAFFKFLKRLPLNKAIIER
jgi:hypothetical protein